MKDKTYTITLSSDMSKYDYANELEKVTAIAHKLLSFQFDNNRAANEPEMQALTQGAGSLNVALFYAKVATGDIKLPQQDGSQTQMPPIM